LRVLTFVFLLIALVLIVLTKDDESEIKFKDFHAYR
jgi:preprotein translocase subunit SecG